MESNMQQSIARQGIVINISTDCEVNSRGINISAKTHVCGSFDEMSDSVPQTMLEAKAAADAIAVISSEGLRISIQDVASGHTSVSGTDFQKIVRTITDRLLAEFINNMGG